MAKRRKEARPGDPWLKQYVRGVKKRPRAVRQPLPTAELSPLAPASDSPPPAPFPVAVRDSLVKVPSPSRLVEFSRGRNRYSAPGQPIQPTAPLLAKPEPPAPTPPVPPPPRGIPRRPVERPNQTFVRLPTLPNPAAVVDSPPETPGSTEPTCPLLAQPCLGPGCAWWDYIQVRCVAFSLLDRLDALHKEARSQGSRLDYFLSQLQE